MVLKKSLLAILCAITTCAFASTAFAGPIVLVDRGLPTDNLNNGAGASRSNVSWVFPGDPSDYWLVGDTFQNTSSQSWNIDTITLWTTGATSTALLWGGTDLSTIGIVSSGSITPGVTYSNAEQYQGSSGSFSGIQQVDFAVSITLLPGQTYTFFLDGTGGTYGVPFVHASNAALSGSPQQGSDNSMLYANIVNGSFDSASVGPWSSLGNGWDKASDVNVVVSGTVPDAGWTMAMLGSALVGFGVLRRRFRMS